MFKNKIFYDKFKEDKSFSDKFIVEIKRILGEHLICVAPIEEDLERNTDLMVLRLEAVRIGCRIRRYKYFEKYNNEFTIKYIQHMGGKTELAKIMDGWGDYFFYGFCDENETKLIQWWLCDLDVFRSWFKQQTAIHRNIPGIRKNNTTGPSSFLVFKFSELPQNFIIAKRNQI